MSDLTLNQAKLFPYDPLTNREIQVVQYILKGLTNKQIADALNIAEGTVKSHAKHAFEKYLVSRRIDLLAAHGEGRLSLYPENQEGVTAAETVDDGNHGDY